MASLATWSEAKSGSTEARERLILEYAPFARRLVARMSVAQRSVAQREDLVSVGVIGMIQAVDRYDPDKRVPFEAFAAVRVRGAVIDELRRLSVVSRDRDVPGLPPALSIDTLVAEGLEPCDEDAGLIDPLLDADLREDLAASLQTLPSRERFVLHAYYIERRRMCEIGKDLGLTEARVSQIHSQAVGRLRRALAALGFGCPR